MATSDKRESAVYVSIEDRSYIGPPTETGRTVYGVILCDRGPDNRVVTVTSQKEYQKLFGIPNIQRCSQTHYCLDKALEYTGKVLVCRVSPGDAELANTVVTMTSTTTALSGTSFDFSINKYDSYGNLWTYVESPTSNEISVEDGKIFMIPAATNDIEVGGDITIKYDNSNYMIGVVVSYDNVTGELVVDIDRFLGEGTYTDWEVTLTNLYEDNFVYGQMSCSDVDVEELAIGDWIYSASDNASVSQQVISLTKTSLGYNVVLDAPYTGTAGIGSIFTYVPFTLSSEDYITSPDDISEAENFLYHFYANGAGTYYNNLTVKCLRNYEMERMYTDNDGEPYYPYIFVDYFLYYINESGTETLLEGPWTVSLIRKTPNGEIIRDYQGGLPTFIEDVVNNNSDFVRVKCGNQLDQLSVGGASGEKLRLQAMLSLVRTSVVGITNLGSDGFILENGSDGTGLYDISNNIAPSNLLYGRVATAYLGSMQSIDGTIEVLPEAIYPKFQIDYIISGGFPINIQYGAAQLASAREDCHHLADTGANYNDYTYDLRARMQTASWNFWTSSLYVQFRLIVDNYTGRSFWITPVYHAIQRHLDVDNKYFLAEPVANIEKGAIGDSIKLAYPTNHTTRGDLFDKELNFTLEENAGVYFALQFTTWKRFSALKRQHIAKFVSYLKTQIPTILRDVVQRRATRYWLSQAEFRMNTLFLKFLDGSSTDRYACVNSYSVNIEFDKQRSELNVYVTFAPILSIERINVFLTIPTEL
jgi:hypothetical protein